MNRLIVFIMMFIIHVNVSGEYNRLSRSEKRNFNTYYKDLVLAHETKNFKGFKVHSELFLDTYKNVLIDPSAPELKARYNDIEVLMLNFDKTVQANQWQIKMENVSANTDDLKLITEYIDFLNKNDFDSLTIEKTHTLYDSLCHEIYDEDKSLETYREIAALKYTTGDFKDSAKKHIEKSLENEYHQLITSLDIEEIFEFENSNPNFYTSEIKNLKEKCRAHDKVSIIKSKTPDKNQILRYVQFYGALDTDLYKAVINNYSSHIKAAGSVNLDLYEDYISLFQNPADDNISSYVEEKLFANAIQGCRISGIKYLSYFPEGNYAAEIREYMKMMSFYDSQKGPYNVEY